MPSRNAIGYAKHYSRLRPTPNTKNVCHSLAPFYQQLCGLRVTVTDMQRHLESVSVIVAAKPVVISSRFPECLINRSFASTAANDKITRLYILSAS